jgi:hypothetical protein
MRRPVGSRIFTALPVATLPIAPWLRLSLAIVTSVRANSRVAIVVPSITVGWLKQHIAYSVGLAASAPIGMGCSRMQLCT